MKNPYQIIKLTNGFQAVLYPQKGLYSGALSLHIRAGHIFEDSQTIGLSHFVEHMIFKGTETHPTTKLLNEYQDEIAFHPSAHTGADEVKIYGVTPKDNLNLALEHLVRMVQQSLFKDEDIEKERSVISEEFLRRRDNPDVYLWDVGMKRRFKGKTAVVGRSTLETVKNIKEAPTSAIKDFFHSFFVPSRMILGIAGNFDSNEISEIIKKNFSKSSKTDSKFIPALNMKDVAKSSVTKFEHDAGKVYLKLSWPVFADFSNLKGALTYNLLCAILSRRIFEILREDLGVVYDFSLGGYSVLESILVLLINTSFETSKSEIVLKIIYAELDKFLKEGLSDQELKQHVRRMNQTSPMNFDYLTSALDWITSDIYNHNEIRLPDECIKTRNTITTTDVERLAKGIFNSEYVHISAIGPVTQAELERVCQPLL